jgi:hypothetical protein
VTERRLAPGTQVEVYLTGEQTREWGVLALSGVVDESDDPGWPNDVTVRLTSVITVARRSVKL